MKMKIIQKLFLLLSSLFLLVQPDPGYKPKADGVLLNAAVVSDTHIDARLPLGRYMLARGLTDMACSSAPVDAVVVTGDMTNYGDGKSVEAFYSLFQKHCRAEHLVIAPGNHDIGHVDDATQEEAKQRLTRLYNGVTGLNTEQIYYSLDVNGYTFIVLGDQSDDSWDEPELFDDQLAFLDNELARAAAGGKPAFVACHWPLEGTNGQAEVWEDGSIGVENSQKIRPVLEKYRNVFFLSGHMHIGINGEFTESVFGFSCVETINGVTYVNLPTYLLVNRFGVPWGGLGFQMEVYEDEVLFRARNYATSKWYPAYEFTVALD